MGIDFSEVSVRLAPLDDLLEEAGLANSTIHFCTIDVEGSEANVLSGFNLVRWRPWILVIEATEPNLSRSSHRLWEKQVLAAGYRFCLFDGVNRFYVHQDKAAEFSERLSYPVCVFDGAFERAVSRARSADKFELAAMRASARADELERAAARTAQSVDELERRVRGLDMIELDNAILRAHASRAVAELNMMRGTISWRVTRPLRAARSAERRLTRRAAPVAPQAIDPTAVAQIERDLPLTNNDAIEEIEHIPYPIFVGTPGPHFSALATPHRDRRPSDWPRWADRLAPSNPDLIEGGLRLTGDLRTGSPEQPLVSYVTVVRNNAQTLQRALESVQNQTYPNVEHIVLDGASIDGTLEVIRRHSGSIDYFASEPDAGLYDALNKAIPLAHGDLICVLNSDDWLEPTSAQTAVSRLRDLAAPALLFTAANVRQADTTDKLPTLVSEWYPALVHPGCYFTCADDCHNGIYATRSAYERSGPYADNYEIAGDFDWIMACLASGVEFHYTTERTMNYVMGGISSNPKVHGEECIRTMRRRFSSLTTQEAGGLHHIFFFVPADGTVPGRPSSELDFLRRLFLDHSEEDDLLNAIAWALVHRYARF
jgi:hypothetical protein